MNAITFHSYEELEEDVFSIMIEHNHEAPAVLAKIINQLYTEKLKYKNKLKTKMKKNEDLQKQLHTRKHELRTLSILLGEVDDLLRQVFCITNIMQETDSLMDETTEMIRAWQQSVKSFREQTAAMVETTTITNNIEE